MVEDTGVEVLLGHLHEQRVDPDVRALEDQLVGAGAETALTMEVTVDEAGHNEVIGTSDDLIERSTLELLNAGRRR